MERVPLVMFLLTLVACGAPAESSASAAPSATPTAAPSARPAASPDAVTTYALGELPEFPPGSLSESFAAELQAVLDTAVASNTFTGATAAVIVADKGSWTGAAGSWDDTALTLDSRHPTHSSGKTVVVAQVLKLVEDGLLGLNDPAADRLPADLDFFDANGATLRQVLAMRSGIPSLNGDVSYPAELAATVVEIFSMLPEPVVPPDSRTEYASTNYVLLGTIIEHATGRPLAEVLRAGVLATPALDGLVYTVGNALASDGWGVESTAATLARWGYELYGGFVLSRASLGEMTDFQGEWYGLGVMDFSSEFREVAIGHQGLSSPATCCSAIILVALPEKGAVIAVQANTTGTPSSVDTNSQVNRLALDLLKALGD